MTQATTQAMTQAMTQDRIDAAVDLAEILARENEALARMDLARAAAMLGAKRRAAEAFERAYGAKPGHEAAGRPAGPVERQLADLAQENRRLLERAIRAQGRVIGTIAGAVARSADEGFYRADGARASRRKAPALTLSARA